MAGRAVAVTNNAPAPYRFRQFSTPRVFDVFRERRANNDVSKYVACRYLANQLSEGKWTPTTGATTSNDIHGRRYGQAMTKGAGGGKEEIMEVKNFSCMGSTIFPELLSLLRIIKPNGTYMHEHFILYIYIFFHQFIIYFCFRPSSLI